MYQENLHSADYLKQVFAPHCAQIKISSTEKTVNPIFFSFMSTNSKGYYQYNHVLIFYEKITEQKAHTDIDEQGEINRLAYKLVSQKKFN